MQRFSEVPSRNLALLALSLFGQSGFGKLGSSRVRVIVPPLYGEKLVIHRPLRSVANMGIA